MKFKKVEYIPFFSKYIREDGKITITSNPHSRKPEYIVTDESGNEIERLSKMKDAKEKYSK